MKYESLLDCTLQFESEVESISDTLKIEHRRRMELLRATHHNFCGKYSNKNESKKTVLSIIKDHVNAFYYYLAGIVLLYLINNYIGNFDPSDTKFFYLGYTVFALIITLIVDAKKEITVTLNKLFTDMYLRDWVACGAPREILLSLLEIEQYYLEIKTSENIKRIIETEGKDNLQKQEEILWLFTKVSVLKTITDIDYFSGEKYKCFEKLSSEAYRIFN